MSVGVSHMGMAQDNRVQNVHPAMNFLVSLLKKHWQNVTHILFTSGVNKHLFLICLGVLSLVPRSARFIFQF